MSRSDMVRVTQRSTEKDRLPAHRHLSPAGETDAASIARPRRRLAILRARLRRGWHWVTLLTLLGAIIGGSLGLLAAQPLYRAAARLEIEPIIARASDPARDSDAPSSSDTARSALPPAQLSAFITRQQQTLRDSQTLRIATEQITTSLAQQSQTSPASAAPDASDASNASDTRQAESAAAQAPTIEQLRASLAITTHEPDLPIIDVACIGNDPHRAQAYLQAIVLAYFASADVRDVNDRANELEQTIIDRQVLDQALANLRGQLSRLHEEHGVAPIGLRIDARAEELSRIELQLTETNIALATLEAHLADRDAEAADEEQGDGAQAVRREARLAQLARDDSVLAALLEQREQMAGRYAELELTLGRNAPARVALRAEMTNLNSRIDEHASRSAAATVRLVGGAEGSVSLTLDELLQRRRTLSAMRQQKREQIGDLETLRSRIHELETSIDRGRARIDVLTLRIEQLTGSSWGLGRVRLAGMDETAELYDDPRQRQAVLGGIAGAAVLMLLSLAVVLSDSRIMAVEAAQLAGGSAPMLGAVPLMNASGDDGPRTDRAAMCIHEIRALLEVRATTSGAQAFAITSSSEGAGKTSVTVGLATSLALAGTRTLLVDCQITGRPAGSGSAADRKIADRSAEAPQQPPRSLDEVMMLMGYLDEADTEIFLLPQDAKVGLVGMLQGGSLEDCTIETGVAGLSILPAAGAEAHHIGQLSGRFIARLIAEARDLYDVVLFDTGPIPGSVEALFVAAAADEVVLIVPRGEKQSRVDRTLRQLHMVHASLAGIVFNRAADHDLDLKQQPPIAEDGSQAAQRSPVARGANMGSGIFAAAVHAQGGVQQSRSSASRTEAALSRTASRSRHTSPQPVTLPATEAANEKPKPPVTADDAPASPPAAVGSEASAIASPAMAEAVTDDDAVTPEDAGEVYRMLLNEELDADDALSDRHVPRQAGDEQDPASADEETDPQAINEMLDDLLDNVIGSPANRKKSDP